jgi:hypothetical protein
MRLYFQYPVPFLIAQPALVREMTAPAPLYTHLYDPVNILDVCARSKFGD